MRRVSIRSSASSTAYARNIPSDELLPRPNARIVTINGEMVGRVRRSSTAWSGDRYVSTGIGSPGFMPSGVALQPARSRVGRCRRCGPCRGNAGTVARPAPCNGSDRCRGSPARWLCAPGYHRRSPSRSASSDPRQDCPRHPKPSHPDHDIRRDRSEKRSQKSRQEILCRAAMTFPSQLRLALMPARRAGLRTGYGSRNDQAIEAAIRDDLA